MVDSVSPQEKHEFDISWLGSLSVYSRIFISVGIGCPYLMTLIEVFIAICDVKCVSIYKVQIVNAPPISAYKFKSKAVKLCNSSLDHFEQNDNWERMCTNYSSKIIALHR